MSRKYSSCMDKKIPHSVMSLMSSLSRKGALKRKLGIRLFEDGSSGYITRPDGNKRYFRYTLNDINSAGAFAIAKYKHLTKQALKDCSIRVPDGLNVSVSKNKGSLNNVCNGFLKTHKFPVVVKPASLSKGEGVSIVRNKEDFFQAIKNIEKIDSTIILEEYIKGVDYRFVVLRKKVVCVFSKHPVGPYTPSNLSLGGIAKDVTTSTHSDFLKLALKIGKELNLDFCGIDIKIQGDISKPEKGNYSVLEVNSAPDSSYFANLGKKQKAIISSMYDDIFEYLINDK